LIPAAFVDTDDGGMHCIGNRCSALEGSVGIATSCGIYGVRPDVCRSCMPGDDACNMARAKFGMPLLDGAATT
jgi:Fe-S-cluster containining protein